MYAKVRAFSKINLFLEVLGKREDGFHEVQMIMQMLRLWDDVYIYPTNQNRILTNSDFVPNNRGNLAIKAAELMQSQFDMPKVKITINKNIPVSGGMAGGSSDAAAVMLGMRALFKPSISNEALLTLGARLGSDIPFMLSGPTAMAYGRGEKLRSIKPLNRLYVLIVKADFGVSTAKVYSGFKKIEHKKSSFEAYLKALESGDMLYVLKNLSNDLERTTFSLYPSVKRVKDSLISLGADSVLMSGSGPTVFALFEDFAIAFSIFHKLKQDYPNLILTTTLSLENMKDQITLYDN